MITEAINVGVSREEKRLAALLPPGMIPKRKSVSGEFKKTSSKTDKLLKREVTSYPSITAIQLKNKHHKLLHNVSTRTICHRLQKVLGLPCRRAAKSPCSLQQWRRKGSTFARNIDIG